jgi:hypothetical protein
LIVSAPRICFTKKSAGRARQTHSARRVGSEDKIVCAELADAFGAGPSLSSFPNVQANGSEASHVSKSYYSFRYGTHHGRGMSHGCFAGATTCRKMVVHENAEPAEPDPLRLMLLSQCERKGVLAPLSHMRADSLTGVILALLLGSGFLSATMISSGCTLGIRIDASRNRTEPPIDEQR